MEPWAEQIDRRRWPAGCTPGRGGWYRWYAGRTRFVASHKTPLAEVEDAWLELKRKLDSSSPADTPADGKLYREVLALFLAAQQTRIGASRNRLAERTFHNYVDILNRFGNMIIRGRKVADLRIRDIGPEVFGEFAGKFATWKASGFDSVVCRVGAMFNWAVQMEYLDRYRPGPQFQRPAKADLRDERIELAKSFTADEIAKLYSAAPIVMRCWIALGICAAFTPSDLAHFPVECLAGNLIDFRRRKTGRVRRVIPLPADVLKLLAKYRRPDPAAAGWDGFYFLTRTGRPYASAKSKTGTWQPSSSICRLFADLLDTCDLATIKGRGFTGLRTSFFNMAPRSGFDLERAIIMGRARGTVDLDSYLEDVGVGRLSEVVEHVWNPVRLSIARIAAQTRESHPAVAAAAGDAS